MPWFLMMILVDLCLDISRDGEVESTGVVIPFKGADAVQFAFQSVVTL